MEGKNELLALSSPQGWSQLPPEILGIILSYLPRKCDLLTGRLVCRSWNQECTRLLKKPESEFNQTLTESNIEKYLNFICNGDNLPQLILPFHLSLTIRFQLNLDNLIKNVESLRALFGDERIQKLTLKTPLDDISGENGGMVFAIRWVRFKHRVIGFLKNVSCCGLRKLDLSDFSWELGKFDEKEVTSDALKISDLKFPKLKTLICYKCERDFETDFEFFYEPYITHPIYKYIIQNSPNLENLEGIDSRDLITMPIRYDKLKSLLIDNIKVSPLELLEKFPHPPVLQDLRVSIKHWVRSDNPISMRVLHNILRCVSTTLKSLTVTVPYDGIILSRFMTLPRLPNMHHLRIDVDVEDYIFLDTEEISFNPETLPMLKSVEFPLGIILGDYFDSDDELDFKEEMEVPVKFTRVNELTIQLRHIYWLSGHGLYKGKWALKHLLQVFPNVAKLSVKNESLRENEQHGVQRILEYLIQSPLGKNIQEICIEGFEQDFMGQALRQMDNLTGDQCSGVDSHSHVLDLPAVSNNTFSWTNVRKIKLGLSAVTHNKCRSDDLSLHLPLSVHNLTAMAKYFPALQIIEISDLLFRGICDNNRKELIQTLATTFPYLWVHVIT